MTSRQIPAASPAAPAPVVAAMLLVILTALVQVTTLPLSGGEAVVAGGIGLVIYGLIAYGLWKGWRGCQVLAVAGGGLAVLTGLTATADGGLLPAAVGGTVAVLLLAPESSRVWFSRHDQLPG